MPLTGHASATAAHAQHQGPATQVGGAQFLVRRSTSATVGGQPLCNDVVHTRARLMHASPEVASTTASQSSKRKMLTWAGMPAVHPHPARNANKATPAAVARRRGTAKRSVNVTPELDTQVTGAKRSSTAASA
eukprot:CAMPEP_0171088092 /NCGR_PEP_ID=MMETSP0766_2-20121228/20569_1 /TAXON_ID=439317 /ORGANISM="Gambierdiscus australes, Strain CAWD 149" /LENGTH=132 /DNA_ID=CAMNT_0011545853 /DNA_START=101 /DNA_END=496 /DNA_ORIENTATION=+